MKRLAPYFQNPELIGLVFGLCVWSLFSLIETLLLKPVWGLLAVVLVTSVAGFAAAGRASHLQFPPERCVRRGAWSGVFAVIAAAACLILMAKVQWPHNIPFRAMLLGLTSAMPAVIAGTLAAGGGALLFRRQVLDASEAKEPPADLPKWTRILIRGAILLFLIGAIFSPLVPVAAPAPYQLPPLHVQNSAVPAAVKVPVYYPVPKELSSSPPAAWTVTHQRELGKVRSDRGLALSSTGRFLSALELSGAIVIYDLESDAVVRIPQLPYPVLHIAFSPDDKRLFVVLEDLPRRVGVVDLETRFLIPLPQPKKFAVPDAPISWWKQTEVIFLTNNQNPRVLDLDSLEFNVKDLPEIELKLIQAGLARQLPSNEKWTFESVSTLMASPLPEVEGTPDWRWSKGERLSIRDNVHATSRTFPDLQTNNLERIFGTMDGSKMLQIRSGYLTSFYLGTEVVPPLQWTLTMVHGPERMKEKDLVKIALERNELSLVMYAPLVNPLNNRIIGPDRERPKAILRVQSWDGKEARVWIVAGIHAYSTNDIFADLHVPGNPPRLLEANTLHRWWMGVPRPVPEASDSSRLPLRINLGKDMPGEQPSHISLELQPAGQATNPPDFVEMDDLQKSINVFIVAHHRAASERRFQDVVRNYADQVDFFKNGIVGRDFILQDQSEYHKRYNYVREKVQGPPTIKEMGTARVEVTYLMANEWQKLSDKSTGSGLFRVVLTLEDQPSGWKIIRHRADKQN